MASAPEKIDPRGPRFAASITSVLLLAVVFLGLDSTTEDAAFFLLLILAGLFFIGASLGPTRHPFGILYRKLVRPRLAAKTDLEDSRPVRFAQAVGLIISLFGLLMQVLGIELGLVVAAAIAFIAAFLNAAFAYCLGCQLYLTLKRFGLFRN